MRSVRDKGVPAASGIEAHILERERSGMWAFLLGWGHVCLVAASGGHNTQQGKGVT